MPKNNIYWAVRVALTVTFAATLCSVALVSVWLKLNPDFGAVHALACATILPLIVTPACSIIMLRTRLRLHRLSDENYRLAHTDDLTALPNRRAFFARAAALQQRAADEGKVLVCAIADIDNFKRVNDSHGHEIGDLVLKHIADHLNDFASPHAVIARLGGEEFALACLCDNTEVSEGFARAVVHHVGTSRFFHQGTVLNVTISLGYCAETEIKSISTLLSFADGALYQAKQVGKNRALCAGEILPDTAQAMPSRTHNQPERALRLAN